MAKNVVKHIWNEITQLFETVYPRTISSNVLHGETTVEAELNNKANIDHTHSRITNNLVIGTTESNKAEITFDVSQAGSPQILMTDNEGDNRWAIGADDADNNFSIKGSTSSNPVINNIVDPPLEITTANVLKTNGKNVETTDHNHSGVYEPSFTKNSGFNKNKSDSVSTDDSEVLATSKAVKTAYDKANHSHPYASDTHSHDSRYYTESEVNAKLDAKQDALTNGVNCKTVTGDWNNVKSTGFYMGSELANQCSGSSWRYCLVMKHNDLWVSQTMFDFNGTSVYQRNLVNGVWGEWRLLSTPPYTSGAITLTNTGWVASNGQYYKDVSISWFTGASDEWVNITIIHSSYTIALVLTGFVETFGGKIRIWATAVPSGNIDVKYQAQRGVN